MCMRRTPLSDSLSLWLLPRRELTGPHTAYSSAHSSIGILSSRHNIGTPTLCKHTVSGSISSPFRAAFQRSITVLVHYRSGGVFSLTASSRLFPTGFLVSRGTRDRGLGVQQSFHLQDYHLLWSGFPADSVMILSHHQNPWGFRRPPPQHTLSVSPSSSP